jgi:hypothetical protein
LPELHRVAAPLPVIWYFRPGTEERVEVLHARQDPAVGDGERWGVECGACGIHFWLRPAHGVTIGPDGALSTGLSCNCPKCNGWHVRFSGGVVQALG